MAEAGAMVSGIGGGIAGVWGGVAGILAGRKNLDIARRNAQYLRMKGQDAIARGNLEAMDVRTESVQRISQTRAGYASQGVTVDTGSAGEQVQGQLVMSQFAQDRIKSNAVIEAWGYNKQAEFTEDAAENAYQAAQMNAYGQFLGAGASVVGAFL